MSTPSDLAAAFNARQQGALPGELGLIWDEIVAGRARGGFTVERRHMAPNGFLHAAAVIALLDTACGAACMASLPDGASGFTTLELKSNFLASAKPGAAVACEARLLHAGRNTQVWDAQAVNQAT